MGEGLSVLILFFCEYFFIKLPFEKYTSSEVFKVNTYEVVFDNMPLL